MSSEPSDCDSSLLFIIVDEVVVVVAKEIRRRIIYLIPGKGVQTKEDDQGGYVVERVFEVSIHRERGDSLQFV